MDIEQARKVIAGIDKEMADLFEKRLETATAIAKWKKERGLPVRDKTQEEVVILRNTSYLKDKEKTGLYREFLQNMMHVTRLYERRLIEGMKIAYSGVEGAFAQIAASRIFPEAILVPCRSFEDAYRAVEKGECENAVLPIENSYAGEVGQVMDLMFEGRLYVNGVYDLAVDHCLLGVEDATKETVKTVLSHPQALDQCRAYISRNGYSIRETSNTAVAAKTVAEKRDVTIGAIASAETASLYGLKVLSGRINESRANTTRFAVFSPVRSDVRGPGNAFLIVFTVSDEAGGLAKAINVISGHGFNMRVLRSRSMHRLPWHYYFYAEIEGDDSSESGKELIEELGKVCQTLKTVGRYTSPDDSTQGGETI